MDRWTQWLRRRSDDDFAAEIESHLAMEVERLVRGGMSEADARFAARRAFGNTTARREDFHERQRWSGLESVAQDVRHGLRAMRRAPGFTAIAVASLAIGIGANTTMFGAIDMLLVRTPAHIQDAPRIHRVYFEMPSSGAAPWLCRSRVMEPTWRSATTFEASRPSVRSGRGRCRAVVARTRVLLTPCS